MSICWDTDAVHLTQLLPLKMNSVSLDITGKTSDETHSGSQVLRALILVPPAPAFASSTDRELGREPPWEHREKRLLSKLNDLHSFYKLMEKGEKSS